jgi:hypothetical protein
VSSSICGRAILIQAEGAPGLKARDGEPRFAEPWQAQALAMADLLIKSGVIAPEAWTDTLKVELRRASEEGQPDHSATYWGAVLSALESVMISGQRISRAELLHRRDEWERAYLDTPHGHPVQLLRE